MTQIKRASLALTAIACLMAMSLVLFAAPSSAAKPKKATELTLAYNEGGQNVCEPNRKVILFEVDDGGVVSRVDKTSSVSAGGRYAFEMTWPTLTSEYYTRSPRAKAGGAVCKAGRSNRVSFAVN